ncbi:hypothetical protein [Thermovibrio sp.]
MSEEKKELQTGVVDVSSPEEVFKALRGEISRITIMRDGKVLDRVLPEEVDDDIVFWVKEKYGGGKYQLILFGTDGKVKKRLSFAIDGPPKAQIEGEKADGTVELLRELIHKLDEKRGSSNETIAVFQMMMQMQQQQFQLLLQTMKEQKRESSFVEKFIDKVLANPAVLMGAGSGILKLLKNILGKRDELIELVKLAKDDPEIKEVAVSILGSKYGASSGVIDRILSNPELLNKTLEIVNKALAIREAGQNPLPEVKRELRKMAGAPVKGSSGNPQLNPQSAVDNKEAVEVQVQEVIALGTKILELAERGADAGAIWEVLDDREVDILAAVVDQYGIRDAEGLVRFLESLPVPRFTVAGYIETIRRHKALVDELLSYCVAEEVPQSGSQEGGTGNPSGEPRAGSKGNRRNLTGELTGRIQEGYRETTGEG